MINIIKFTIFFSLYTILSIVVALAVSFTSAAWIVYAVTLLPLYLVCNLYYLSICLENRHAKIKLKASSGSAIIVCQILFMLASPADCYMWNQGRSCYSFIQAHLDRTSLDPPHWSIELMFPIALLIYIILMIKLLRSTYINSKTNN
jgi:hypothetical protein